MADLAQLFAKAQEAQAKLSELQHKLAARRVEGTAGGGMVRAEVSGALRVLKKPLTEFVRDYERRLSAS